MEPTLTSPDSSGDPLDALLSAAPPRIADDGFSARVCATLPCRQAVVPPLVRWLVLAGAAFIGCALAWSLIWVLDPLSPGLLVDGVLAWKFEWWQALPFPVALTIWGALAVSRNEWEHAQAGN